MMTIINQPFEAYPSFRQSRTGPEKELVDWFLEQKLFQPRRGERVTIFREPRLPSGFPDLVAVVWKESVVAAWESARRDLAPVDLRVMHYLATTGSSTCDELLPVFGAGVYTSLERLLAARMIFYKKGSWTGRSLNSVFAARRIVAVEAKVAAWRVAVEQAFLNTWFAPESYILLPSLPRRSSVLEVAHTRGIGVLWREPVGCKMLPQSGAAPRSYISWLLNDWAWKVSNL